MLLRRALYFNLCADRLGSEVYIRPFQLSTLKKRIRNSNRLYKHAYAFGCWIKRKISKRCWSGVCNITLDVYACGDQHFSVDTCVVKLLLAGDLFSVKACLHLYVLIIMFHDHRPNCHHHSSLLSPLQSSVHLFETTSQATGQMWTSALRAWSHLLAWWWCMNLADYRLLTWRDQRTDRQEGSATKIFFSRRRFYNWLIKCTGLKIPILLKNITFNLACLPVVYL